jgi:hypothetical protein
VAEPVIVIKITIEFHRRSGQPLRSDFETGSAFNWEQAMAKTGDEKPDDKAIQKRIKEVNEVSKKLAECNKNLKNAAELVKDLDKLAR